MKLNNASGGLFLIALSLCAAVATTTASAQGFNHRGGARASFQGGRPQQGSPGQSAGRIDRIEESRGSAKLSPEERRQLRHDVNQAGRDLYPDRSSSSAENQSRGR